MLLLAKVAGRLQAAWWLWKQLCLCWQGLQPAEQGQLLRWLVLEDNKIMKKSGKQHKQRQRSQLPRGGWRLEHSAAEGHLQSLSTREGHLQHLMLHALAFGVAGAMQ